MGVVPTAVGLYQLRTQKDALLEQVQRSHIVAATSAADRVDAYLQPWLDLADTLANSDVVVLGAPRSPATQDLVRSLLSTRREMAAFGLFRHDGVSVLQARQPGIADELPVLDPGAEEARSAPVALVRGVERTWLRVVSPVGDGPEAGRLVLAASAEELGPAVQALELGDHAQLVLMSRSGGVLVGGVESLASFPEAAVELASAGKVGSGCSVYRDLAGGEEELVVAHASLRRAPWFVMSRQPATVAEQARREMRRAAWLSGAMAFGLTLVLASVAWSTVIRPIRRLAAAQRDLVGLGGHGSEILDLEASFELLRQRIHDSEDLGQVFIGRYQVTDLVGSGAMGSVFRGWDAKLRRPVALKTVHLDAEAIDQRKLLNNLREEAAITARIHQPNIVTVYDIEEQGHVAFLAMEYVEGVDLQSLLNARGALDARQVIPLAAEIARGLAAAHEHGLVHHDVKPGNVLLGTAGEVKLTDFGVSQLISASTKARDVICGTPGYLAPECFEGGEYGPEADLWAFGVVLYQCTTGRQPFRGRDLRATVTQTMQYEPDRLTLLFPGIDESFAGLVEALIAKDPKQRPESARHAADQLDELRRRGGLEWCPDISDLMSRPQRQRTTMQDATRLFSTQAI